MCASALIMHTLRMSWSTRCWHSSARSVAYPAQKSSPALLRADPRNGAGPHDQVEILAAQQLALEPGLLVDAKHGLARRSGTTSAATSQTGCRSAETARVRSGTIGRSLRWTMRADSAGRRCRRHPARTAASPRCRGRRRRSCCRGSRDRPSNTRAGAGEHIADAFAAQRVVVGFEPRNNGFIPDVLRSESPPGGRRRAGLASPRSPCRLPDGLHQKTAAWRIRSTQN